MALMLAACDDRAARTPFTDSRIPPGLAARDWPPAGWAWGLIQIDGHPPQRYGVAAPASAPRAQVLILPGYGAAAEDAFPLASALIDRGYEIWTLDGAGQGGSGRSASPRDLGHVEDFAPDLTAIDRLIVLAIRPRPQTPLVLIADRTTALIALRRMQMGAPVAGAVLRAPSGQTPGGAWAQGWLGGLIVQWAQRLGLGAVRAPWGYGWSRLGRDIGGGDAAAQTASAWRRTDAPLRMGGPSFGWIKAFADLRASFDRSPLRPVTAPVLMLAAGRDEPRDEALRDRLCAALPHCVQGHAESEASADEQIIAFIEQVRSRTSGAPNPQAPAHSSQARR